MGIKPYRGISPALHPSVYVADGAQVIGDVAIGEDSSVWYNAVLRADIELIRIGRRTNIQDLSLVHVNTDGRRTTIGDDVTVGHQVAIHGCAIGDRVLVGMGAILLDGVVVEDDCLIAAGSLLTPGTRIAAGSLVMGSPARVKRPLTDGERAGLLASAAEYVRTARAHAVG
ncbi:MAG: gamma carbonic anhydrase family protein [Planctomycetes bacterium]|nr:gamma carbonic anhydrase family protein [Planctomycetota bacterium]